MRLLGKSVSITAAYLVFVPGSLFTTQTRGDQLELRLTVEPLVVRSAEQVKFRLEIKNSGAEKIFVLSQINLWQIRPYGYVSLESRLRDRGGAYGNVGMAIFDPGYPPPKINFDTLMTEGQYTVLVPGHFIGREIVEVAKKRFPVPGIYEVRLHYTGSPIGSLITEAREKGMVLPEGDFLSNVVTLEVRP